MERSIAEPLLMEGGADYWTREALEGLLFCQSRRPQAFSVSLTCSRQIQSSTCDRSNGKPISSNKEKMELETFKLPLYWRPETVETKDV